MMARVRQSRYFRTIVFVIVVSGYTLFSLATGWGDAMKASLNNHPMVMTTARVLIMMLFFGSGIAWLLQPNRTPSGRATLGSRLLVFVAFVMAALQAYILVAGNPFN